MNGFAVPVSMLAPKSSGGVLAAGVIGLLIVLALTASREQSAKTSPATR